MPVLKREHRAPVQPEITGEEFVVEDVGNLFVIEILVLREEQLHDLHRRFVAQTEFAVSMRIFAAVDRRTHQRIVRVVLVEPVVFVQYGNAFGF